MSRWSAKNEPVRNEFSGVSHGGTVQAGTVVGGIHIHHGASDAPLPVPRQLLAAPAYFTDRTAELGQLDAWLHQGISDRNRMFAVLSGPGGMGKTALALQWAHTVHERFSDGQLYIDLAGFSGQQPVTPSEALGLFLRSLGLPPRQVPVELVEQASLYRSLTARRSLLVVLDNAFSAAQVRPLVPTSPTSAIVVTSRSRLTGLVTDGARLLELSSLSMSSAVRMLARTVGDRRISDESDPAEKLADLCGGLPIAVCVAAARLAARPTWSVSKVVAELGDEQGRLARLSTPREISVQTTFDLSYRTLASPTAIFYRRLASHPGRDFGPELTASLSDGSAVRARELLEELVEANMVEEFREDRYRFHDLLRLHAREKAETDDDPGERELAVRRMVEWYLAAASAADLIVTPHRRRLRYDFVAEPGELPEFTSRDHALTWLEHERANLIAAGRMALERGWAGLAWHLSDVMWPLLLHHKHYQDRLEIDERGVVAARLWGNRFAEADMLKRLGRVCTTLGRFDEAERHLLASIERASSIDDSRGAADAGEGLALLYLDQNRTEEALAEFEGLARTNRELGADRNLGLTMINLGDVLSRLGRTADAMASLREAEGLFDHLAEPDPYNRARVSVTTAQVHLRADQFEPAENTAARALETMTALGSHQGRAQAHEVLAEVAHRRGDTARAVQHWEHAMRLFTKLGSSHASRVRARLLSSVDGLDP